MRALLIFGLIPGLLLAACGGPERRSDGVTPSEARALDNAAAKVDAQPAPDSSRR